MFKKSISLEQKSFKTFLESRQEIRPKAETIRRQDNKGADRKMELNKSPEIPDRWETSEVPGLPSGP